MDEGLRAITTLVHQIANGTALHPQLLTKSRLIPLTKDNGKVRPIAIGESIVRLASRILQHHRKEFQEFFRGTQFGVSETEMKKSFMNSAGSDP